MCPSATPASRHRGGVRLERRVADPHTRGIFSHAMSDSVRSPQPNAAPAANARMPGESSAVANREAAAFAQHHAGSALREEGSGLYRLLVESVRDYAIFVLDPNGIVSSWNAGAERLKGYTADEII